MDAPISTNKWSTLFHHLVHANNDTFKKEIFSAVCKVNHKICSVYAWVRKSQGDRANFEAVMRRASELKDEDNVLVASKKLGEMALVKLRLLEGNLGQTQAKQNPQLLLTDALFSKKVEEITTKNPSFTTDEVLTSLFIELGKEFNKARVEVQDIERATAILARLDRFNVGHIETYQKLLFTLIITVGGKGSIEQWQLVSFPTSYNREGIKRFFERIKTELDSTGSLLTADTEFRRKLVLLLNSVCNMYVAKGTAETPLDMSFREQCGILDKLAPRLLSKEVGVFCKLGFNVGFPNGVIALKPRQFADLRKDVPALQTVELIRQKYTFEQDVDPKAFQKMIDRYYKVDYKYPDMSTFKITSTHIDHDFSMQDFFEIASAAFLINNENLLKRLENLLSNALYQVFDRKDYAVVFELFRKLGNFLEKYPIPTFKTAYYHALRGIENTIKYDSEKPETEQLLLLDNMPPLVAHKALQLLADHFGGSWYNNQTLFKMKLDYYVNLIRAELKIKRRENLPLRSRNLEKLIQEALYIQDDKFRLETLDRLKKAFPEVELTKKSSQSVNEEDNFGEWENIEMTSDVALELDLTSNRLREDVTGLSFAFAEMFNAKMSFSPERLSPLEGLNVVKLKLWDNVKDQKKIKERFPRAQIEIVPTPKEKAVV